MKKFLMCCIVIIVALFLGFTTYYIVANKEYIALANETSTSIKMNVGEKLELSQVIKHLRAHRTTVINVDISDREVLEYNKGDKKFIAKSIGNAVITITPSNEKFGPFVLTANIGDGSSASYPYYIRTATELARINENKSYELVNDIYLKDISWTPLIATENDYMGTFNGANYVIYDMNVKVSGHATYGGLFAKVGSTGVVKNIKFVNANVEGSYNYAGIVAGLNKGTVCLCEVIDSTMNNGGINTGMIVGSNQYIEQTYGNMSARVAMCGVVNSTMIAKDVAGGIVGLNVGSIVENCYVDLISFSGNGTAVLGGIVGSNVGINRTIESTETSKISIIYKSHASIRDIKETSSYYGIVGQNSDANDNYKNSFIYDIYTLNTKIAVKDKSLALTEAKNVEFSELKNKDIYDTWDFNRVWTMNKEGTYAVINYGLAYITNITETIIIEEKGDVDPKDPDDPTPIDPTPIGPTPITPTTSTFYDAIKEMWQNPDSGKSYSFGNINENLNSDKWLSAEAQQFFPLGKSASRPFTCKIYSSGRITINYFNLSNVDYASFFGYMGSGASVNNMTFNNANVTGNGSNAGIIAAEVSMGANIVNCQVKTSTLKGKGNLGLIAGVNYSSLTNNSVINSSKIEINGTANAGLIVGQNDGTISRSNVSSSNITATINNAQGYFGGVVGYNNGTISDITISANINLPSASNAFAGGVCGYSSGTVYSITSSNTSVILSMNNSGCYAGGLIGANNGSLSKLQSLNSQIKAYYAGGLSATNTGNILMCTAGQNLSGSVTGVYAGGLVSINQCGGNVENCLVGTSMIGSSGSQKTCGFGYKLEEGSSISHCFSYAKFSGQGELIADSDTPYRNWFSIGIWQHTIGYVMGALENCLFTNDSNVDFQGYGIGIDLIDNPFISKYDIVLKADEAKGSDNFKKFFDAGFSSSVWNFSKGSYPTIK